MPPELLKSIENGMLAAAQGQMSQMTIGIGMKADGEPIKVRIVLLPENFAGALKPYEKQAEPKPEESN